MHAVVEKPAVCRVPASQYLLGYRDAVLDAPLGLSADGLPLGLQLIGRPFDEETLFRAADVLERQAGFDATPAFTVTGEGG